MRTSRQTSKGSLVAFWGFVLGSMMQQTCAPHRRVASHRVDPLAEIGSPVETMLQLQPCSDSIDKLSGATSRRVFLVVDRSRIVPKMKKTHRPLFSDAFRSSNQRPVQKSQ